MFRSLLAVGLLFGLVATADAARVTSFVVKCIDRQEISSDDIYLAGVRDGNPVPWGKNHQAGTSSANSINLTDGGSLSLEASALGELKFENSLSIAVKEKDVTGDEVIGTVNLTPTAGHQKQIFKTSDFEYHVEYTVE